MSWVFLYLVVCAVATVIAAVHAFVNLWKNKLK